MTDQMAQLAAEARRHKPRLFAIYGRFNDLDDPEFVGWGMDFPDIGKTLYYDPDTAETHRADTPGRLLEFYKGLADARLEWLDAE